MSSVIKRKVKGKDYYYLEKPIRVGKKIKKVSLYFGKKKPSKKELKIKGKEFEEKALENLYKKRLDKYKFSFLTRKELAEIEQVRENFFERFDKLSKSKKESFYKKQLIDFVYTTLRTEGVDVDFSDVETAYKIIRLKREEPTLNSKVIVSSSMIAGFNFLPKIMLNEKDVLRLHGIVMSYFEDKTPGQLRDDQRIIARFNPLTLKSEEISYRPPFPEKVKALFEGFFEWFEKNKNIHPLELAALVHLKIYLIHPFKDGNKRMCRLLFNKVLLDNNYPLLNISKQTSKYFEALIKSVETGQEKFFVKFCYKTFIEQVKNRRLK